MLDKRKDLHRVHVGRAAARKPRNRSNNVLSNNNNGNANDNDKGANGNAAGAKGNGGAGIRNKTRLRMPLLWKAQKEPLPDSTDDSSDDTRTSTSDSEGDFRTVPRSVLSGLKRAPPRLAEKGTSMPFISMDYIRKSQFH